jgi:hypothetical protein
MAAHGTRSFRLTPLFWYWPALHQARAALRSGLQRDEEGGVAEKRRRSSLALLREAARQSGNNDASQSGQSQEIGTAVDFLQ